MDSSNANNRINGELYEEIDFREIVRFLDRNKFYIIKITLLAAVVVFAVSYFMPKVYKVESVLQIGNILDTDKSGIIEDPAQIKGKIDSGVYTSTVRGKLNISQGGFPKIIFSNPGGAGVISLALESSKTEQGKQILQEINDIILADHKKVFDLEEKFLQNNIEIEKKNETRLNNQIQLINDQKKIFGDKIAALQNLPIQSQDIGIQLAILNAKEEAEKLDQKTEDYFRQINDKEKSIASLQAKIDGSLETLVIKDPNISESPVKPRILLNTAIAAILGLMGGMFLAFLNETLKKKQAQ